MKIERISNDDLVTARASGEYESARGIEGGTSREDEQAHRRADRDRARKVPAQRTAEKSVGQ